MSLEQYRDIARRLPRPTDEQIADYVQFVAHAHSWYKHLPLVPPGIPFRFFLDPCAGMDRYQSPNGSISFVERTESTPRFHYTWMTTADYRARFGHLAYDIGPTPFLATRSLSTDEDLAKGAIAGADSGLIRVPLEITDVATVDLTGVVHEFSANEWLWDSVLGLWMEKATTWAAAMNKDDPLLVQVRSHVQRFGQQFHERMGAVEKGLMTRVDYSAATQRAMEERKTSFVALLTPERERLLREMNDAIHRMLTAVYDASWKPDPTLRRVYVAPLPPAGARLANQPTNDESSRAASSTSALPYERVVYVAGTNPFALQGLIRQTVPEWWDGSAFTYALGTDQRGPMITVQWVKLRAKQTEAIHDVVAALIQQFGAENVRCMPSASLDE